MITPISKTQSGAANATQFNKAENDAHSTDGQSALQVVCERMDRFKRLEAAFNKVGWNFHPLADDSYLAVHRKWQMSHVCQDFRAAFSLLKRVGGAA